MHYTDWLIYQTEWASHHAARAVFDPTAVFPVGAGASGAVFGIAGALIVLLKSHRLPVPPMELQQAAQVGDLLCRNQSGDGLHDQPWRGGEAYGREH